MQVQKCKYKFTKMKNASTENVCTNLQPILAALCVTVQYLLQSGFTTRHKRFNVTRQSVKVSL